MLLYALLFLYGIAFLSAGARAREVEGELLDSSRVARFSATAAVARVPSLSVSEVRIIYVLIFRSCCFGADTVHGVFFLVEV